MSRIPSWSELSGLKAPLYLAIGVFDGVHRGHAALIGEAVRRARERGGVAWALTFDPHPLRVLHPEIAPPSLTTLATRLRLIRALGVGGCVLTPFTLEFARLTPDTFLESLRQSAPTLTSLVVGPDWRFGNRAGGDIDLLRRMAPKLRFEVVAVPPVLHEGEPISSTRIRRAITAGDLGAANAMLGRAYAVEGAVVHGRGIGRRLGFPTANLAPDNEVLPPPGIYAARLRTADGRSWPAAAYRGTRPTLEGPGAPAVLEAHILDATLALYGQRVELELLERIREDRRFSSTAELCRQIEEDIRAIRHRLAGPVAGSVPS